MGIFPPLPPVWEPHVCEKKKLWFILHFRTLGTFLVFTKMFSQFPVFWGGRSVPYFAFTTCCSVRSKTASQHSISQRKLWPRRKPFEKVIGGSTHHHHLRMTPGGHGSGPGFSTLQVFTNGVLGGTDSPSPMVMSAKKTIPGKLELADSRSK